MNQRLDLDTPCCVPLRYYTAERTLPVHFTVGTLDGPYLIATANAQLQYSLHCLSVASFNRLCSVSLAPSQQCKLTQPRLRFMIRCIGHSWFCLYCVLFLTVTCGQLPTCQQGRKEVAVPSVSACQRFVKLLEDPQYCSLDQLQNCCVVLTAAVTSHCHCWKSLPKASHNLVSVLHKHCEHRRLADISSNVNIKLFIGVLTSAAHAEQRQAGDSCCS